MNITRKVLKVGVFVDPPLVNENWPTGEKPGFLIEVLALFCRLLKVECSLIEAPEPGYGVPVNGTWKGMVKYISENMFDIAFPGFTPTPKRSEVIQFSDLVYRLPLVLVTRRPRPSTASVWNFLGFDWTVWLCLLITSAFIGLFLAFSESTRFDGRRFFSRSLVHCIDTFGILSNQGPNSDVFRISARLMLTFWASCTVILGGVYSGHLLSSMLDPNKAAPFNDFDSFVGCMESRKCQLVTGSYGSSYIQTLFTNTDPTSIRLNYSFNYNPLKIIEENEIISSLLDDQHVYLTWYTVDTSYMFHTKNNKNCSFIKVDSGAADVWTFPLSRNFTMKRDLNGHLTHVKTLGIIDKMYQEYVGKETECNEKQSDGGKPLPFTSIFGVMLILACGCLFGFGSFMCENVISRCLLFNKTLTVNMIISSLTYFCEM